MTDSGLHDERRSADRPRGDPLRVIIDRLADGIIVVGTEGQVRFANPAAATLFGRPSEELVGEPFGFPVLVGEATEIDILRRGTAPVVVELRVVETEWDGEAACVVSLRDITDRKEAEQSATELAREQAARTAAEAAEQRYRKLADEKARLASENARLYQSSQQANHAKSEFLGVMSHELRTPLNAIIGYTDLLMGGLSGEIDDLQRQQLQRIDACSHHLLELVEDILSYSRIEAGKEKLHLAPVDYQEVLDSVAALVRPAAEQKRLAMRVARFDDECTGTTDPAKVRQILINLVSNAIKFTEEGEVALNASQGDGKITFQVRDTGIGIPADRLSMIWEPFWQVEQSRTRTAGGTGLGLSVVKRLAELLGGTAAVESTSREGSLFTVQLPLNVPAAAAPEQN